jgi:hypothetical protein
MKTKHPTRSSLRGEAGRRSGGKPTRRGGRRPSVGARRKNAEASSGSFTLRQRFSRRNRRASPQDAPTPMPTERRHRCLVDSGGHPRGSADRSPRRDRGGPIGSVPGGRNAAAHAQFPEIRPPLIADTAVQPHYRPSKQSTDSAAFLNGSCDSSSNALTPRRGGHHAEAARCACGKG